jgi:hypothetical protein
MKLSKKANELCLQAIQEDLSFDNREYINSMKRYINKYTKYREKIIINYINDLKEINLNCTVLLKLIFFLVAPRALSVVVE